MKGISILVTVLMAPTGYAAAVHYAVPFTCQITYSPYALEFGRSGLIPECVRYSPYALGYGYSGLIPDTVRYSPYAFDYQHSGLISDVGCCLVPCGAWDDALGPEKGGLSHPVPKAVVEALAPMATAPRPACGPGKGRPLVPGRSGSRSLRTTGSSPTSAGPSGST